MSKHMRYEHEVVEDDPERDEEVDREALEMAYLDLQEAAQHAWAELSEYLASVGSPLLDKCVFPDFMEFAARINGLEG